MHFLVERLENKGIKTTINLMDNSLLVVFFFFLPFNYALTFNLGFPLKISEIVLFLYSFLLLFRPKLKIIHLRGLTIFIITIFIIVAFISCLVNLYWDYPYPLNYFDSRFGYKFDSLLKFFYIVLAYFSFLISGNAFAANQKKYLNALFAGGVVASVYAWYLSIGSFLGIEVVLLPGMGDSPQSMVFSHYAIIRCGTMKEGNYMGLFLFLCGVLAYYSNNKRLSIFFFISVLTAMSTMAIGCTVVFIAIQFVKKYLKKGSIAKSINYLIIASCIMAFLLSFEEVRFFTIDKLFVSSDLVHVDNTALSKADRLNSVEAAYNLGKDNLFFGVGLSNYALHYREYYPDPRLYEPGFKNIINNIYAEIFAEVGIIGFVLFMVFLVCLFLSSGYDKSRVIRWGFVLNLVYFLTFPSFTMLFVWVFWGFIVSLKNVNEQ